jgi:GrpB-like predicted nucleotidyltransferase (UPF0157 family)
MTMLEPYDPSWRDRFAAAAEDLNRFGNPRWVIEHIGSTAVPGLAAKPIIDIAVRVQDEADFERHRPGLEERGWRIGSGVRSHRVMLLESGGTRTHIAHFFDSHGWDQVNQRIFRDWLMTHPDDARRYAEVKRRAAAAAAASGENGSYNSAKTDIVQQIVDQARAKLGLKRVLVHDK